ncbi:hypothetical protein JVU11DRAFT_4305 [Chiua virens]|nr:hypothetical protein JVU11DRAFT_4305 [Chiua virens]
MNVSSSAQSNVPAIHIHNADYSPALFDGGEIFSSDMSNLYNFIAEDTSLYACSQGMQSEALAFNPSSSPAADLEDMPELSHLTTMNQPFLTDHGYSQPYSIIQEHGASADGGLSPSSLGSPAPSPTSSFASSLSPSSLYDSLALSDTESFSPYPDTPDSLWPAHLLNHQSSDSLTLHPSSMGSYSSLDLRRPRSKSSPSFCPGPVRSGPVASKAMLEANGRRRRHPAQFVCEECQQTFTALFSLKRHQQSHTGERPHACSIPGCNQRFFNSSDCKRHEKSRKRHKDLQIQ